MDFDTIQKKYDRYLRSRCFYASHGRTHFDEDLYIFILYKMFKVDWASRKAPFAAIEDIIKKCIYDLYMQELKQTGKDYTISIDSDMYQDPKNYIDAAEFVNRCRPYLTDRQVCILEKRLEFYGIKDIASKIGVCTRTIDRELDSIRKALSKLFPKFSID